MKNLNLLITVSLLPFFCCFGQDISEESGERCSERYLDMYGKAFEYIKQDTFFKEKNIYVSDTLYLFQVDKDHLVDTLIDNNNDIIAVTLEEKQMIKQNYDSTKNINQGIYCKPLAKLFRKQKNRKATYNLYFNGHVIMKVHNRRAIIINDNIGIVVDIVNNGGFPAQNAYGMNWEKECYRYVFYFNANNRIYDIAKSRIINNKILLSDDW